jgi:Tetratricopeptide repeat
MRTSLLGVSLLALLAGCASHPHAELQIKPVGGQQVRADNSALATAEMLLKHGEYALAADAYRKAIRFDPADAAGYNGLAISYDQLGRFDLSRRYYELALARAPREPKYYRNLAHSLERQGQAAESREILAQADAVEKGLAAAPQAAPSAPDRSLAEIARDGIGSAAKAVTDFAGPRLERLSMGEVELFTKPGNAAPDRPALAGRSITVPIPAPSDAPRAKERLASVVSGRSITVSIPPPETDAPAIGILQPAPAPDRPKLETISGAALASLRVDVPALALAQEENPSIMLASATADPAELLAFAVHIAPAVEPSCDTAPKTGAVQEFDVTGSAMLVFTGDYAPMRLRGSGGAIDLPLLYPASANLPVARTQAGTACNMRMADAPVPFDARFSSLWNDWGAGAA